MTVELPRGAGLSETMRIADQAAVLLRAVPDVDNVVAELGSHDTGLARLYITLKPARERSRTRIEFEHAYARRLRLITRARISFQAHPVPPAD